jgi:hypothetical protein
VKRVTNHWSTSQYWKLISFSFWRFWGNSERHFRQAKIDWRVLINSPLADRRRRAAARGGGVLRPHRRASERLFFLSAPPPSPSFDFSGAQFNYSVDTTRTRARGKIYDGLRRKSIVWSRHPASDRCLLCSACISEGRKRARPLKVEEQKSAETDGWR